MRLQLADDWLVKTSIITDTRRTFHAFLAAPPFPRRPRGFSEEKPICIYKWGNKSKCEFLVRGSPFAYRMRALTWQINGSIKYLIGIMLITRWLPKFISASQICISTDHICQHSAKPQSLASKSENQPISRGFGVQKGKKKNKLKTLTTIWHVFCEPLNPPGTPLPTLHWIHQEEP